MFAIRSWQPLLLVSTALLVTLGGCAQNTCHTACVRVYEECEVDHSDPDITTVDKAVEACTESCLDGMYNSSKSDGTTVGVVDEQSAVAFINCVEENVDPGVGECATVARNLCGPLP